MRTIMPCCHSSELFCFDCALRSSEAEYLNCNSIQARARIEMLLHQLLRARDKTVERGISIHKDGILHHVNAFACHYHGRKEEDLRGQSLFRLPTISEICRKRMQRDYQTMDRAPVTFGLVDGRTLKVRTDRIRIAGTVFFLADVSIQLATDLSSALL